MNTGGMVLQALNDIPDIEIIFDKKIGKGEKHITDAGYAERLLFAGESLYV